MVFLITNDGIFVPWRINSWTWDEVRWQRALPLDHKLFGMKEKEMRLIASFIAEVFEEIRGYDLPTDKKDIAGFLRKFEADLRKNQKLRKIEKQVKMLCKKFPAYKK